MSNLKQALGLNADNSPFPWQEELLAKFIGGMAEWRNWQSGKIGSRLLFNRNVVEMRHSITRT